MQFHQHQHETDNTTSNLRLAFLLNLGFTLLEIVGGLWTNSIAILSDALHDLSDSLSLGMAWYFNNYAQKEPDADFSYGYRRFSMLGAFVNAIVLIGGSLWVLANAIPRLLNPAEINAPGMIGFALVGIVVNGAAAYRLRRNQTMNAQVVGWHLLEDVLGWTAVLIVSIILLFTDWTILDPILSILITLYILANVVGRLQQTARLFLQATPENVSLPALERQILELEPVQNVHHTHVWSLDGEHHVLTTHVIVAEETTKEAASHLKQQIARQIKTEDFEHLTIEVEFGENDCRLDTEQIVRERHQDAGVALVGFGSHRGTVIAADAWGDPMEIMPVPEAQPGSWEDLLHRTETADKLLLMDDLRDLDTARQKRGHRAIGVVYHPQRERGNYVPTILPERYDAFIYIDDSRALHPLHLEPAVTEPPETYPWGV